MIEVEGLRIAYARAGDGPALVLLHGYVGDGHATWRRQLEELSDEHTVVAWDAPGAGRSSDPPDGFGMPEYADCLARFVDALGLERPYVAGLSFGGALALELYRRHPSVPRALVLASAYAGWAGSLPADVAEQRLRQALELAERPPEALAAALLPSMFAETAAAEDVGAFAKAVRATHPPGFRAMALASAVDLGDVLNTIDIPTLLVYGDADVRAPLSVAHALPAAIRGSTLVVLEGAGHVCNVDAPERFDEAVRGFLRAHRD